MNAQFYYGLESQEQAQRLAMSVCDALGWGKWQVAPAMLMETACAETQLGTYPDSYEKEGHGLHQFDTTAIADTIERTRRRDKLIVFNIFGVDVDQITAESLQENPLHSFILCRLKYKLIPDEIPADFVSRAMYWKRHYNTEAGAGTVDHYLESAERILYSDIHDNNQGGNNA